MTGPLTIEWTDDDDDEFTTVIDSVPVNKVVTGEADITVHPDGSVEVIQDPKPNNELPES